MMCTGHSRSEVPRPLPAEPNLMGPHFSEWMCLSAHASGIDGVGIRSVVAQSSKDTVLEGVTTKATTTSALESEAEASILACIWAKARGGMKVWIHTDAQMVALVLQRKKSSPG